jgi:MFS family permease
LIESGPISLSSLSCLCILSLSFFLIYYYQVGLSLGLYLSTISFGKVILIGPLALIWFWALTTICSGIIYYIKFYINSNKILVLKNKVIIPWMIFWWIYTFILILIVSPPYANELFRNLLMYIILPIFFFPIIGKDEKQIRLFFKAYIFNTLINGLLIYKMVGLNLDLNFINNILINSIKINNVLNNYHRIGTAFGITSILLVGFILNSKKKIMFLIAVLSFLFIFSTLVFIGSRQMILASLVSIFIYFYLHKKHIKLKNIKTSVFMFFFISLFISFILMFFENFQEIIFRSNSFENAFNDGLRERKIQWEKGMSLGLKSVILGTLFETRASHNLFIGTFESEGLAGLVLFIGYLLFAMITIINFFKLEDPPYKSIANSFFVIFIFGIIHGQFSGDFISIPHLYWPVAFLWVYSSNFKRKDIADNPIK